MTNAQRVAIITGASQGIGEGLVSAYRKLGYAVIANAGHQPTKRRPEMQKTTAGLAALAIGAAIAISIAPPASADSSKNCQTSGAVTVCAQGSVTGGGAQSPVPGGGVVWPVGCTTPYGTYQNCAVQGNRWYWGPM